MVKSSEKILKAKFLCPYCHKQHTLEGEMAAWETLGRGNIKLEIES